MAQLDTQILPLLPLTSGVVLPGMVVTLTIESDEARRAIAASESSDGELLLVPRIGNRYAKIGTVAKVEDVGRLPSGLEALVIRGMVRAVVGTGVAGTGETATFGVSPAIANAIHDALGIRCDRLPFSPPAVLALLRAGDARAAWQRARDVLKPVGARPC